MIRTIRSMVLTTAILMAAGAQGAETQNLMDLYQIALQRDALYQNAQAQYLAAREARPQARSFLLPQINATGSVDRIRRDTSRESRFSGGTQAITTQKADTQNFTQTDLNLSVSQVLFDRGLFVGLDQADATVAQAEAQVQAALQDLIVRLAQAYFDVLGAEDTLRFTEAEKDAVGRQLDQARKRFEVGLIAITDVKESQANYDRTVSDEIVARNAIQIARNTLSVIIGQYVEELSKLSDRMRLVSPDPDDPQAWIDKAWHENLNLIATRFATETARLEVKRQRAGHYPTLDLLASGSRLDQSGGSGFIDNTDKDLRIGAQLNIPIFTGGLVSSRTREAQYNFEGAQDTFTQTRRETAKLARDAYLNVISGISEVRANKRRVESAKTAAEATEAGFEVGTRTSVDVLIAIQGQFSAEREFALSRYRYLLNTLRLKQAAGTLTVHDLQTINAWLD